MSVEWQKAYREHVADIPSLKDIHYEQSADRLRKLLKSEVLTHMDIFQEPERFFKAHDILSEFATLLGPGFGIRFTVQFNLFAGTILELGNEEQVKSLMKFQKEGKLGCFCLTEALAGVNSGLVVNTTAEWVPDKEVFVINCPNQDAHKNWISQGLTADMCVVVANLIMNGKSHGAHAFLTEMRRDGKLVPGVSIEDMGFKTIGNDLDNARVSFANVEIPKSALLDRHAGIVNGEYQQKKQGISNMDMIGQRLYTGRTVIAASCLVFARTLFRSTKKYTDNKRCWQPKGTMQLSEVPQIANLYEEADKALTRVEALCAAVQRDLGNCLRTKTLPSTKLVEQVACLKVKAIEQSIDLCFKLKQELGSFALMGESGFDRMDYLQCCKFAEGDSRILMQKIARDRLQSFSKKQEGTELEVNICTELGTALMAGGRKAWNENWKLVYGLAEAVIERTVDEASASSRL